MRQTRFLLTALLLGCLGQTLLLAWSPSGMPWWLRDGAFASLLYLVPVLVLHRWWAADRSGRPWALPLTAAAALFLLGHLVQVATVAAGRDPFPTWGDVATLGAYPFLLAGLLLALRGHVRGVRLFVALDGLAGAVAGAALTLWAITPLVDGVWDRSWSAAVLLGSPLFDAVLVSGSLGALAVVGREHLRQFGLWATGTLLLAVADLIHAHLVVAGAAGTAGAVDGAGPAAGYDAWLALPVVLALGLVAAGTAHQPAEQLDRPPGARSLGIPAVASGIAVVVLAGAPSWSEAVLPQTLALLALAAASVRFARAFLQLRELADVREQAMTDELTGVANRRALYQYLDELLAPDAAAAAGGDQDSVAGGVPTGRSGFAVALIDLDHFKEVNDTLGHHVGDALLKAVVERFSAALTALDTPHLFARLGGDEFAVVLHEATTRDAALIVGQVLQESLIEPMALPDATLHAQASIGFAVAPEHGATRSDILNSADAAMYRAKTSGTRVVFHRPARAEADPQLATAEDLYRALEHGELTVDYQPIATPAGQVVAAEALLRWDHPERGRLETSEFIEAAERYKLTAAIARRVLDLTLGDAARWQVAGLALGVSVNLGAADLHDETVVALVAEALLEHQVPPGTLTLEIGEAAIAQDPERAREVIVGLRELGVLVAVDDYGLGGASLELLMGLPLDVLKLDRKFSRDAAVNDRFGGVAKAGIDLAHALDLRMVAEGVEDQRALERLAELGCDLVQGWHVGRPMPAAALEAKVAVPTGGKHRMAVPEQGAPSVFEPPLPSR